MDIKITTNFSFGKLSSNLDKIINQYTEGFVKDSAEGTKQKIDKGVRPDIEKITKDIRTKRTQSYKITRGRIHRRQRILAKRR